MGIEHSIMNTGNITFFSIPLMALAYFIALIIVLSTNLKRNDEVKVLIVLEFLLI